MKNYKNKNGNVNSKILQELIDELSYENIITGGTDRKITEDLDRLYRVQSSVLEQYFSKSLKE